MDFECVLYERTGSVARVTINRPEKLNALNKKTRDEIRGALDEATSDEKVRSVILAGAGDRAFSSGQDLEESMKFDAKRAGVWIDEFDALYLKVLETPKPIVTSTQGYATGAGWQTYLLGDYRIASEEGKFGMPELKIGIPCITGSAILAPLIGLAQVSRLTIMADIIGADEALRLGLVHEVVPGSKLESATFEAAMKLAELPPTAVRLQKEWLLKLFQDTLRKGVAQAKVSHMKAFASGEPQGLMQKFVQKRSKK